MKVNLSRRLAEAEDLSLIAVFVVETLRKLRMLPSKSSLYLGAVLNVGDLGRNEENSLDLNRSVVNDHSTLP
jgi:hypothetical protein